MLEFRISGLAVFGLRVGSGLLGGRSGAGFELSFNVCRVNPETLQLKNHAATGTTLDQDPKNPQTSGCEVRGCHKLQGAMAPYPLIKTVIP